MGNNESKGEMIPIAFRITKSEIEYIQDIMIQRREFNKSEVHREIFLMGLKEFKKRNKK